MRSGKQTSFNIILFATLDLRNLELKWFLKIILAFVRTFLHLKTSRSEIMNSLSTIFFNSKSLMRGLSQTQY